MHKNSVMEEERVKVSHPAANGETLSAGNHHNCLCLLSEVDFETNILQISEGKYEGDLQGCSEDVEGQRSFTDLRDEEYQMHHVVACVF